MSSWWKTTRAQDFMKFVAHMGFILCIFARNIMLCHFIGVLDIVAFSRTPCLLVQLPPLRVQAPQVSVKKILVSVKFQQIVRILRETR